MTYALTFLIALVIAVIATPVSMKLAKRWGAIAYPGGRHVHSRPIPRLGGIALYAAFWIAALVIQVWDKSYAMDAIFYCTNMGVIHREHYHFGGWNMG